MFHSQNSKLATKIRSITYEYPLLTTTILLAKYIILVGEFLKFFMIKTCIKRS